MSSGAHLWPWYEAVRAGRRLMDSEEIGAGWVGSGGSSPEGQEIKEKMLLNYLPDSLTKKDNNLTIFASRIDLTISPNISPLQLVSSGLIPASDLSDGVGDIGGLELVLPNRMTRPGTIWANDDNANLNPPSLDCCSEMAVVVGEDVMVLAAEVCWLGCKTLFFKTAVLPPFCSW